MMNHLGTIIGALVPGVMSENTLTHTHPREKKTETSGLPGNTRQPIPRKGPPRKSVANLMSSQSPNHFLPSGGAGPRARRRGLQETASVKKPMRSEEKGNFRSVEEFDVS